MVEITVAEKTNVETKDQKLSRLFFFTCVTIVNLIMCGLGIMAITHFTIDYWLIGPIFLILVTIGIYARYLYVWYNDY